MVEMDLEARMEGITAPVSRLLSKPAVAVAKSVCKELGDVVRPFPILYRSPKVLRVIPKPLLTTPYTIAKNTCLVPADLYRYARGRFNGDVMEGKIISHSLAAAEVAGYLGAWVGAYGMDRLVDNRFVSALAGGFIGSEIATAGAFFAVYFTLTSVVNRKQAAENGSANPLWNTAGEAFHNTFSTMKQEVGAFFAGDVLVSVPIAAFASSELASSVGAFVGSVLHVSTTNVAIHLNKYRGKAAKDYAAK